MIRTNRRSKGIIAGTVFACLGVLSFWGCSNETSLVSPTEPTEVAGVATATSFFAITEDKKIWCRYTDGSWKELQDRGIKVSITGNVAIIPRTWPAPTSQFWIIDDFLLNPNRLETPYNLFNNHALPVVGVKAIDIDVSKSIITPPYPTVAVGTDNKVYLFNDLLEQWNYQGADNIRNIAWDQKGNLWAITVNKKVFCRMYNSMYWADCSYPGLAIDIAGSANKVAVADENGNIYVAGNSIIPAKPTVWKAHTGFAALGQGALVINSNNAALAEKPYIVVTTFGRIYTLSCSNLSAAPVAIEAPKVNGVSQWVKDADKGL